MGGTLTSLIWADEALTASQGRDARRGKDAVQAPEAALRDLRTQIPSGCRRSSTRSTALRASRVSARTYTRREVLQQRTIHISDTNQTRFSCWYRQPYTVARSYFNLSNRLALSLQSLASDQDANAIAFHPSALLPERLPVAFSKRTCAKGNSPNKETLMSRQCDSHIHQGDGRLRGLLELAQQWSNGHPLGRIASS